MWKGARKTCGGELRLYYLIIQSKAILDETKSSQPQDTINRSEDSDKINKAAPQFATNYRQLCEFSQEQKNGSSKLYIHEHY